MLFLRETDAKLAICHTIYHFLTLYIVIILNNKKRMQNVLGMTALHYSMLNGYEELSNFLIDAAPDTSKIKSTTGRI